MYVCLFACTHQECTFNSRVHCALKMIHARVGFVSGIETTYPPTYLPTYLCFSIYLSIYLPIYLSIYLCIYLSVCMSCACKVSVSLPPGARSVRAVQENLHKLQQDRESLQCVVEEMLVEVTSHGTFSTLSSHLSHCHQKKLNMEHTILRLPSLPESFFFMG